MRLSIFHVAALVSCFLFGGIVQAYDGTINILGTIVNKTCNVATTSIAMQVDFGNVSSKTFISSGEGSRYEPFILHLENCGAGASNVTVTFSGGVDLHDGTLLALDTLPDAAKGVGIAFYDHEKKRIPINQSSGSTDLMPNQANVALLFYVRYLANGDVVSAGSANASSTFVLNYA